MKLTELNPRWYVLHEGGPKVGLTFDCPHCRARRLGVAFHHAGGDMIADAVPDTHGPGENSWTISGDQDTHSFENVTLMPSVDASSFGCWHGFITNGEIA